MRVIYAKMWKGLTIGERVSSTKPQHAEAAAVNSGVCMINYLEEDSDA